MRQRLCIAIAVFAMTSHAAAAAVVISSNQSIVSAKTTNSVSAFFEADRLKIVTPQNTVIFRGDLNKAWVITASAGTYVEITPDVVTAFSNRLAAAQTPGSREQVRLQERLAKLPPDQRALAEQQLRAMTAGAGAAQPASYTKAGASKTVSSWRCDVYARAVGNEQQEELCIAPLTAVGLAPADFRVLELFNTFMGPLAGSNVTPRLDYLNWPEMNKAIGFSGIPLENTLLRAGQPAIQDIVLKVEKTNIPADAFELPAGLTKRELTSQR
jgi:hypothetical protein